jgi:rhodanese-related sulfurtransferase
MKLRMFLLPLLLTFGLAAGAADLVGVTTEDLQGLMDRGAVVVDVRTPEEWKATGLIPGSRPLTYYDSKGQYDQAKWLVGLRGLVKSPNDPVVLVCRSGNRSATVGKMLAKDAGYSQVYHLEKGIRAWIAESRKLTPP